MKRNPAIGKILLKKSAFEVFPKSISKKYYLKKRIMAINRLLIRGGNYAK